MTFEAIPVLDKNPNVAARNLVDWAIGKGTNPEQPTFTVLGNLIYPLLAKTGLEAIRFLATLSLRYGLIAPQILQSMPEIGQHVDLVLWSELEPSTDGVADPHSSRLSLNPKYLSASRKSFYERQKVQYEEALAAVESDLETAPPEVDRLRLEMQAERLLNKIDDLNGKLQG